MNTEEAKGGLCVRDTATIATIIHDAVAPSVFICVHPCPQASRPHHSNQSGSGSSEKTRRRPPPQRERSIVKYGSPSRTRCCMPTHRLSRGYQRTSMGRPTEMFDFMVESKEISTHFAASFCGVAIETTRSRIGLPYLD